MNQIKCDKCGKIITEDHIWLEIILHTTLGREPRDYCDDCSISYIKRIESILGVKA